MSANPKIFSRKKNGRVEISESCLNDMESQYNLEPQSSRRVLGIAFGIGTQVLFLITIWFLFWFLKGGEPRYVYGESEGILSNTLWIDALLAMQFALPHSLLLLPSVRKFLGKWIAREFYALFYCVVTCIGLLATFALWRGSSAIVWQLHGLPSVLVQIGFYGSWIALFYSLNLTGFGTQTGLPQWWHWVRRHPLPFPKFNPHGAYRLLRHPVYLSFAGLIWFTPRMTFDHAILTGFWTLYILFGSCLKDRRMEFYLGDVYRVYQQHVPGYPLMPFGPLARRRAAPAATTASEDLSKAATRRDAA